MSVIFNVIICRRFYKEFIKTLFFSRKNMAFSSFFSSFLKGSIRVSRHVHVWEGRSMRIRSKRTTSSERFRCRNLDATRLPARAVIEAAEEKNLLSSARASSYCFVDHRFHGFFPPLLNFSVEEFVSNIKLIEWRESKIIKFLCYFVTSPQFFILYFLQFLLHIR